MSFSPAYSSAFDVAEVFVPPPTPAGGPLAAYAVRMFPNISWSRRGIEEWLTIRQVPYDPQTPTAQLLVLTHEWLNANPGPSA